MDFNQIKELISIVNDSSFVQFELNLDNAHVKMSKNAGAEPKPASNPPLTVTQQMKQEVTIEPVTEQKAGTVVTSPIVGTYYDSQNPQSPPFVKVGDKVKAGDVLCIIEAMKVMNEITAESDGEIAEIMAVNEQMVEYNEPLFRVI